MRSVFNLKIDFKKSHGSYLYDKNSKKEYLDLHSMYSSIPLGYNHPIFDNTFSDKIAEISKIRCATKVFQTDEIESFYINFRPYMFSNWLHLTCTGAQAVEAAIKCALERKKEPNALVIAMENSFHGIGSWGFITDRVPPTAERMKYFPRNNWKNLCALEIKKYIQQNGNKNLAAIVVEPIQCTAGDIYVNQKDLVELNELCIQNDICFIVDEIQTGFGVTGNMWYSSQIGLTPDILVFGKKAQTCGIIVGDKYNECLTSPFHKLEVTFDGELIDIVRSEYVLRAYEKFGLIEKTKENNMHFTTILSKKVKNYRSVGHLIAFDFDSKENRDEFVAKCLEKRVICNSAGEKTVRLRPNMAISNDEISHFESVIKEIKI